MTPSFPGSVAAQRISIDPAAGNDTMPHLFCRWVDNGLPDRTRRVLVGSAFQGFEGLRPSFAPLLLFKGISWPFRRN